MSSAGSAAMGMQRGEQPGAARAEDQDVGSEPFQRHTSPQNTRARKAKATTADTAAASKAQAASARRAKRGFPSPAAASRPACGPEQEHEDAPSASLTSGLIAPAQEAFEPRLAVDRQPEREEMERQEDRQRQARKPVHERRQPEHVACDARAAVMAAPPRPPPAARAPAAGHRMRSATQAARARRRAASIRSARCARRSAACTAAATTKTP